MFPVDLPDVEDLTSGSALQDQNFPSGSSGLGSDPVLDSTRVPVTLPTVTRLQLFDDAEPSSSVLALVAPDDPSKVLVLYLRDAWWAVQDVLRTCSGARNGLVQVRSMTERLIVFLLSRVVERRPTEAPLFTLHPRGENCKLLWRGGEAVAFYTVKRKGALCDGWSGRCYALPVLDSLQVRRSQRRRGHALHMLDDFCRCFAAEDFLGISSPLSPGMVAVLRKFLGRSLEQRERLYEVEAPGGWTQRRNIWLGIRMGRYPAGTDPGPGPGPGGSSGGLQEESCTSLGEEPRSDQEGRTLDLDPGSPPGDSVPGTSSADPRPASARLRPQESEGRWTGAKRARRT
ncbi:unnamed protein product [Ophioblennius macclurei]